MNAVLKACVHCGDVDSALRVFEEMPKPKSCGVNEITYGTLLKVPIYARAQDLAHLLDLKKVSATDAILENAETSLQLRSKLLKGLGVMSDDVNFLSQLV
ncbi:hypothetical protein NMG60_11021571 [Bertholletia excelsa]